MDRQVRYRVQYRNIWSCYDAGEYYDAWMNWDELGEFDSILLAMNKVLHFAYTNIPGANIDNFHPIDFLGEIYEVGVHPRDWQFRFLELWTDDSWMDEGYLKYEVPTESPWKIGLNDV